MKAEGLFNPDWEAIYQLDPEWLEQFLSMGADLYGGVLEPKLVELMAVAVDASCTHLYTPGIRRHVRGALAQGATIEEIMGGSQAGVEPSASRRAIWARRSSPRNSRSIKSDPETRRRSRH